MPSRVQFATGERVTSSELGQFSLNSKAMRRPVSSAVTFPVTGPKTGSMKETAPPTRASSFTSSMVLNHRSIVSGSVSARKTALAGALISMERRTSCSDS